MAIITLTIINFIKQLIASVLSLFKLPSTNKLPVLSLKLVALAWITAKRQIIHDRTASRTTWDKNYDFIIVGAGTAGSTLAYRLTENPDVKVLLLEAGGAQNAIYSDMPGLNYNITDREPNIEFIYYSEPQLNAAKQYPDGRPVEPLGKVIGGSSSHNTMIYNRGNRLVYDEWANKYGAVGWSFNEVLPYFIRYENNTDLELVAQNSGYHGTSGKVEISSNKNQPKFLRLLKSAYNELGFEDNDFNGPKGTGTMFMQQFIDSRGFRSSAGNAYIDPNPHPNNLHIVTKALVIRILFEGLTAVGVEFAKNDRPCNVYARKEVILTAGVAKTPQLLMLSGIGVKSHLEELGIPVLLDLPVGNNYQNHPEIRVESKIKDPSLFYPGAQITICNLRELYYERKGRLSESPFLGLYFSTERNGDPDFPNGLSYDVLINNIWRSTLNFVRVLSRGTIRLQSTSPYDQPILDPALLSDPVDFDNAVDAMTFTFKVIENSSIAKYVKPPSLGEFGCPVCPNKPLYECTEGIRCYIKYHSKTTYHPCCSCPMGNVNAVVDPLLRVKGINNLRICDASVFPSIPNSNPNAATHMVAEKAAQIIKDFYNLGH